MNERVKEFRVARWRVFEAIERGWWGIEIEDDNDADPILYSQKALSREKLEDIVDAHNAAIQAAKPFQLRVSVAHHALFHDDPTDVAERRARYFEESGETVQAFGMTEDEAITLVRYTWSRPAGEPRKEIGAAALTLASLCVVAGHDMMECAEADLEKLQRPETIERIRAKRATRHGRGPLPGFDPASTSKGAPIVD